MSNTTPECRTTQRHYHDPELIDLEIRLGILPRNIGADEIRDHEGMNPLVRGTEILLRLDPSQKDCFYDPGKPYPCHHPGYHLVKVRDKGSSKLRTIRVADRATSRTNQTD